MKFYKSHGQRVNEDGEDKNGQLVVNVVVWVVELWLVRDFVENDVNKVHNEYYEFLEAKVAVEKSCKRGRIVGRPLIIQQNVSSHFIYLVK